MISRVWHENYFHNIFSQDCNVIGNWYLVVGPWEVARISVWRDVR